MLCNQMSEFLRLSQKVHRGPNFNDQDCGKPEDRRLTEVNGEIGYFVKKGKQFVPVTNFPVTCTGFVAENLQS